MPYADVPTRAELVDRVAGLVPVLRGHELPAAGPVPAATMAVLSGAGVFRARVPRRQGGYGCDSRTLVGVAAQLGRAGAAVAWTAAAHWASTWLAGVFGARARDEVFGTPGVLVSGTPAAGATATPVADGFVVDGAWEFVAGAWHAHWQVAVASAVPPAGAPFPVAVVLPRSDLRVTAARPPAGAAGTGGGATAARGVFVPAHRVVELSTVEAQWSSAVAGQAASSVGVVLGMALDGWDWYLDGLVADHATVHARTTDALAMIDEAELHADRLASLVDGRAGADWTEADSARVRDDLAAACGLVRDAVHVLAAVSGPGTAEGPAAIRRLARDLDAATRHVLRGFDDGAGQAGHHAAA